MFVLRLLVKAIKLLNSETSAGSIAAAVTLGLGLGLMPLFTLQSLLVVAAVLFLRVNLTGTLVSWGVFTCVSLACWPWFDALGVALLESPGLRGLWTWLYHSPLNAMRTHEAATLGATLAALALAAPVWFGTRAGIRAYRQRVGERAAKRTETQTAWAARLRRLYTWVDSPFGAP